MFQKMPEGPRSSGSINEVKLEGPSQEGTGYVGVGTAHRPGGVYGGRCREADFVLKEIVVWSLVW